MQCTTTAGTTLGAERFITGATPTEQGAAAADLTVDRMAIAADFTASAASRVSAPTPPRAAESTTIPAPLPGLSRETDKRLEDTLHPAVRPAHGRVPSAATAMAGRQRAIRHAAAPASVTEQRKAADLMVAEDLTAAVVATAVGTGNRSYVVFLLVCKTLKWREAICGER